jgi:malate dehydrogenase (oxaloacetate-decarboxylating)
VQEFVTAVKEVWPGTLLQWEDFGKSTAMVHLNKYRDDLLTFNDDIQGTAAVVDAGLRAAADHLGKPLQDMNIVLHGAGSAGIGIAMEVEEAMVRAGCDRETAHSRFVILDSRGVVFSDRDRLEDEKAPYASAPDRFAGKVERDADGRISLEQLCEGWQIDALLGVSGQPGVFHEQVVKAVAAKTERPIIMPLSNPTANAEATPENLFKWTDGKCLVATGSPFAPCQVNGREVAIGQGNNMFIFPGVGLGAVITKASTVTMGMFLASAQAVRECLPQDRLDNGTLYPDITDARKVARAVAVAVGNAAHEEGVAGKDAPQGDALAQAVDDYMWYPEYLEYRPA